MKIVFEDKSFIEFTASSDPDIIVVSIGAKDYQNHLKLIVNSIEITKEQLQDLYKSIL